LNRPKQEYRVGIGAVTMLTIFVVLCVTTLALLALSGARGDAALTSRALEMTQGYYQASDRAQRVIAKLDEITKNAASGAPNQEAFEAQLAELEIDGVSIGLDGGILSFDVDAGGGRALSVAIQPSIAPPRLRIERYALTGGELWTGEAGSMNLLN
jgi:hypothetical protein